MTPQDKFTFLDTKRKLMSPFIDPAQAEVWEHTYSKLAELGGADFIPSESRAPALRQMDADLERVMVEQVVDEDAAAIRVELKKKFGFSSFGDQPERMLKRILTQKRIRNEEEAKLVQDLLSGDYLGWTVDDGKLTQFSEILDAYGRR